MFTINEWRERYEVSLKGREPKEGEELRAGPLSYIRLKVYGHRQGAGYRRLQQVCSGRFMEVFGVFCKFLEISGNQPREKRGSLLNEKDEPATISDLAFILGVADEQASFAVESLCQLGWVKDDNPSEAFKKQLNITQHNGAKSPEISGKIRETAIQAQQRGKDTNSPPNTVKSNSEEKPEQPTVFSGQKRDVTISLPDTAQPKAPGISGKIRKPAIAYDYDEEKFLNITPNDIEKWGKAFPVVNIEQQIQSAGMWLRDNPTKRKSQVKRFITNWMRRQQEKGGDSTRTPQQKPTSQEYTPPPANVGKDGKTAYDREMERIETLRDGDKPTVAQDGKTASQRLREQIAQQQNDNKA